MATVNRLLGASILGTGGDEVINYVLDIMYAKVEYTVMQRTVHIHPTIAELLSTVLVELSLWRRWPGMPRMLLFEPLRRMRMVPRVLSVNVGIPKDIDWRGKTVHTAIWKEPVQGRHTVRRLNIDGDGQGDLAGYGGEHRAVMVYRIDSYRYWERHFDRKFPTYGQFGENLTVDGLHDDDVCIGDHYQIGDALLEVTQPRVTCHRVGIRIDEPPMASLLVAHHRPGFYMRVLQEGDISAGDDR